MKNLEEYIASGIIEMYVLGLTSKEESSEIESLADVHPEIRAEIDEISDTLIALGNKSTGNPAILSPAVKPFLMAIIDYTERLKNGEQAMLTPSLTESSRAADFSNWLNRDDMVFDSSYGSTYAKIIGHTPQQMTAIVWLKEGSPQEKHDNEYEKFLILEGSCDIITKNKVFSLVAGSYFQIPLHLDHSVKVTSEIPCKLILQRMAA